MASHWILRTVSAKDELLVSWDVIICVIEEFEDGKGAAISVSGSSDGTKAIAETLENGRMMKIIVKLANIMEKSHRCLPSHSKLSCFVQGTSGMKD